MKYSFYIIVLLFFVSCDPNRVFEKNISISDSVWEVDEVPTFDVEINDTVTPHNFYINLRQAGAYPYSNIYVFITTTFPNGKIAKDTIECSLADPNGKWLGDGMGDVWDNQILFVSGKKFPLKGTYTFAIEQGMRTDKLPFVMDVGLRIEKEDKPITKN